MLKRAVKDIKLALRQGETTAARNLARQVLALEPDNAAIQDAMALVEAASQNYAAAKVWHEKATAAEPDNPFLKISFASTLTECGEFADAQALYMAAIQNDPANGMAYQRLAWIRKAAPGDPLIDMVEKLKTDNRLSTVMKIKALFALGKWYDDIGDYDKAFANYKEANELTGWEFDMSQLSAQVSRIKSIWSEGFLRDRAGAGCASAKPVFIVGMPRSGSTLLEKRLCEDPRIASLGERPDIVKIIFEVSAKHPRQALYPEWAPDLPVESFLNLGRQYLEQHKKLHSEALRFVDKTLTNYLYAGFIRVILPQARIIESRRNPLDTCLSCYFTDLNFGHQYKTNLRTVGLAYKQYDDLMEHWRNTLDHVIRVDYEKFIQDPDDNTLMLRNEIGLLENADGTTADTGEIRTWSAFQARQPIYQSSMGRWKNYEKHLGPLIEALKDVIT